MATPQGLSGIDVRTLVTEWERLLPLWVDKAYEVAPGVLLLRLKGKEHAKYQLLVEPPTRAHLTAREIQVPKMPTAFPMLLRKYLLGGRVLSVRQHGIQRIVLLEVGKSDHLYRLVIELFDRGNVILCDRDWTIIQPLRHLRFRERDVVPGATYTLPPEGPATSGPDEFVRFLSEDPRDVVRALAVGAMLGGPYAEYICRRAGIEKRTPAREVPAAALYREVEALLRRTSEGIEPVTSPDSCIPFPLDGGGGTAAGDPLAFNRALDTFFPPPTQPAAGVEARKAEERAREDHVRARQQEAVRKLEEKIAACERAVEALYSHYPLVSEVLETLRKARERYSWHEIEAIVRGAREGPATRIVAFHPERNAIEMDLGERVTLIVEESIEANAAVYYEQIKKYRRKIAGALAAMERVVPVRERRETRVAPPKKRWYHRFRWFYTSDGALVVGGRDASQNEELVKKYMEGNDFFVHADVHGAPVVIVKGQTEKWDEVACFAASYSGAWKSGHHSADVYCVRPEQVSKTPEAGEYVAKGGFIVRGERRYFRDVPLGVAIGLRKAPAAEVIGGPPAAVRTSTDIVVGLVPGRFEPNDAAKKVLRALREKLSTAEQKDYRKILTEEAVAAFVPPGGSDLMEGG